MQSARSKGVKLAAILLLIGGVSTFECPEFCDCSVTQGIQHLNHAKCSSLEGLKTEVTHLPIHSLDLSHADLTRMPTHLDKLRDLVELDLSHNKLSEVTKLSKRIKTLNLSYNRITSGKLSKIPNHVENLDLSYNEVTYLPIELKNLLSLKSIELTGNSINCTCETLDVRNWLQKNHVWTHNHIKCSYPVEFKGQPWLRIRQSDVCEHPDTTPRSIALRMKLNDDDENDLMLGDQPVLEGSGERDSAEELGKDFLLVHDKKSKAVDHENLMEGSGGDYDEGIHVDHQSDGHSFEDNQDNHTDHAVEEDDEGSGGGMLLPIPRTIHLDDHSHDVENETSEDPTGVSFVDVDSGHHEDDGPLDPPHEHSTESSDSIFKDLGIADFDEPSTEGTHPVEEEIIVPFNIGVNNAAPPLVESSPDEDAVEDVNEESNSDAIKTSNDESENIEMEKASAGSDMKATYIVLGIIVLALVVLIVYVAVKRGKSRNRRPDDAESPRATELLDMDKKNLGKPINKNGNTEHAPLIGDRSKADLAKPINGEKKTPYNPNEERDNKLQEPLLKKLENAEPSSVNEKSKPEPESNNNITSPGEVSPGVHKKPAQECQVPATNQKPGETSPVTTPKQVYPPPKSKSPSTGDDDVFLPSSPKTSSRYSPVYSPETGRVKIKLTETAKPKTPILVNRSRSNAGDIITTPTSNERMPNGQ